MNKIELIDSLIKETEDLTFLDDDKLNTIKMRARIIIRNNLNNPENYIKELDEIQFTHEYQIINQYGTQLGAHLSMDFQNSKLNIWISGKNQMLNFLNILKKDLESFEQRADNKKNGDCTNYRDIFIVHGHDEEMKQAFARVIEKLDLRPIILHEQSNEGRTIIEKITDYSDISFAIILLSPDDIAYPKDSSPKQKKLRVRQNVIFELGFFIGKLERSRVFVLYKEDDNFEMPSDYHGNLYIPYDIAGNWKFSLTKELRTCGFNVDANRLI